MGIVCRPKNFIFRSDRVPVRDIICCLRSRLKRKTLGRRKSSLKNSVKIRYTKKERVVVISR